MAQQHLFACKTVIHAWELCGIQICLRNILAHWCCTQYSESSSIQFGCRACQGEDGKDDLKKGTQLLEVYALEIQMHTELKNTKRLKELYSRALTIKSAIPHPRIMGIIRECGGKMHMHERVWSEAATDFFEVMCNFCTNNPPGVGSLGC